MFDSFEDEMDIGHVLETQNINETEFRFFYSLSVQVRDGSFAFFRMKSKRVKYTSRAK